MSDMDDSVFISFILPIYNVKDYLRRCVDSITSQPFGEYEVLLVDDGSTDGSAELCDRIASEDSRIRALHKVNGGLASARNHGLRFAKGRYVFFVDSDDYLTDGAAERIIEALNGNGGRDVDILKFDYVVKSASVETRVTSIAAAGFHSGGSKDTLIRQAMSNEHGFVLSAWSHIYRRRFLLDNDLRFVSEREIGSEDYPFNLSAYLLADSIRVVHDHNYVYDLRDGSLTGSYRDHLPEKYTKLYRLLSDFYREHGGARFTDQLVAFYIWITFGTCAEQEYRLRTRFGRSRAEASRTMRGLLDMPEFRRALSAYDGQGDSLKRKVYIALMRLRWEWAFRLVIAGKQDIKHLLGK